MKRQLKEIYGRGPRLRTAEDRTAALARAAIAAFVIATLGAWALW